MKDSSIKRFLVKYYEIFHSKITSTIYLAKIRIFYRLNIMTSEKTLKHILKHKCSVARYGDGEFSQILSEYNIGFQRYSPKLSKRLLETLHSDDHNLLICVPKYLSTVRKCNKNTKQFWLNWGKKDNQQVEITKLLRNCRGKNYLYGDTQITRPYMDLKSKKHAETIFALLKKLWDNRNILIVEGKETRLGIGNDLFSNAKSISRILAPAKNAFDSYDEILTAAETYCKDHLVLIALGPTATVLAADLSARGIQALDVGHMDIEYEWFLQQATEKVQIHGKFSNELKKPVATADCVDPQYLSQIIYTCK